MSFLHCITALLRTPAARAGVHAGRLRAAAVERAGAAEAGPGGRGQEGGDEACGLPGWQGSCRGICRGICRVTRLVECQVGRGFVGGLVG
jgi:hypothetical protein